MFRWHRIYLKAYWKCAAHTNLLIGCTARIRGTF